MTTRSPPTWGRPAAEGGEFQLYADAKRQWQDKLAKRQWAAAVLNEGKGATNLADMAELAILEQLHDLAAGGAIETGKDVATVARAITSLQRTQLARAEAGRNAEIERLKAAHVDEIAAKDAEIARLQDRMHAPFQPAAGRRN